VDVSGRARAARPRWLSRDLSRAAWRWAGWPSDWRSEAHITDLHDKSVPFQRGGGRLASGHLTGTAPASCFPSASLTSMKRRRHASQSPSAKPTPRPRRPRLGPSRRRVGASARPPLGRLKRGVGRKTRASTTAAGSPARHFCPILRTLNWFSARRRTDLPELRLFVVSPNCQQSASWTAVRGKASMIRRASHSTAVGER
jgi:hypothetical protein